MDFGRRDAVMNRVHCGDRWDSFDDKGRLTLPANRLTRVGDTLVAGARDMGNRHTTNLPPELAAFASLVDAQPAPVRAAFQYCLALAMVEAGKARLLETRPGASSPYCTFETSAGDAFTLPKPAMSQE